MTIDTMTLQRLAEETSAKFETFTRGADDRDIWRVKDEYRRDVDWLLALCRAAHNDGDMMSDDWRYQFIVEALDAIAEADDVDDIQLEVEPYTNTLTGWLHSRNDRLEYVDQAIDTYEGGDKVNTFNLLAMGQLIEREEVLASVRQSLGAQLDELVGA